MKREKTVITCLIMIILLLIASVTLSTLTFLKSNSEKGCTCENCEKKEEPKDEPKDEPIIEDYSGDKVKVYIFEAGGCPWCERQKEYLKGLESYGKKFVIVTKELYVDHINWQEGKDYELGKKVAEAFNEAGFADATYNGTPLVIISDLYAASAYSESLEKYINQAYELKDKDIVSCLAEKDDCPIGTTE